MDRRRVKRALAWRATVLVAAVPGGTLLAALPRAGAPSDLMSAQSAAGVAATTPTVEAQISAAEARLATNLNAPHAGKPEAISHPDADHMGIQPTAGSGSAATGAAASALAASALAASAQPEAVSTAAVKGLDVSSFQGDVNWAAAAASGGQFAYMKATEGTYYTDSTYFAQQYNGSYSAGLVRGSYHFAIPNNSTGAAQADYFVAHGGGWSGDGHTLPGTLDIEYNPYGAECYGLTPAQMVGWIQSFDSEYQRLTGRIPTIYTTAGWWSACTGNSGSFGQEGLAIAAYSSSPNPLPASWGTYQIWQYADSGVLPGDQDVFNGTHQELVDFAYGTSVSAPAPSGPSTIAASVPLSCTSGTDRRTTADATVQPGVVVSSGGYHTYTVTSSGQLLPIPTSAPSAGSPLVAVWQNSTDCSGAASSRNSWATGPNGVVYAETDQSGPPANNYGDTSKVALWKPVVGMSPTSDAAGYWLVASDGGVFSYGDAHFFGSTGGVHLVQPIVGMATTPDGGGYWMVASDGGIFAFGDAHFHGSLGGVHLVEPIEAMVATPDGKGYWMVASDGGIFAFGDATFHGSMGGHTLSAPIAGMVPNGSGYTLIGQDGTTYPFA